MNLEHKLTVSLVTWNGARYLPFCLQSLVDQTFQDFNLVIIDNGSKDGSADICASFANKFAGRFELIRNAANEGFDVSHNSIMRKAESDYVMLLNQDIMLAPEYLQRCVEFLDAHANTAAVSGKILKWNVSFDKGTNALLQSEKTTTIDSLGLQIFKTGRVIERGVGTQESAESSLNTEVFGVSGTVPVYRKRALETVAFEQQYLDNDFFAYKEDIDLSFRLRWAGYTIFVVGNAVAHHDRNAKSSEGLNLIQHFKRRKAQSKITRRNSYRNHLWMLRKNISAGLWRQLKYSIMREELKKFLFILCCEWGTLPKLIEVLKTRKRTNLKRAAIMNNRKVADEEMLKWFK